MQRYRASAARSLGAGAVGFGLGGAVGGPLGVAVDVGLLGFLLMGAVGGAALALAAEGVGWRHFALAGGAGAFLGFTMGLFIVLALWEPAFGGLAFSGLLGGVVTGLVLGLALRSGAAAGLLAAAGGAGFLVGGVLADALRNALPGLGQYAAAALVSGVLGLVGGAALGFVFGYLGAGPWTPRPEGARRPG